MKNLFLAILLFAGFAAQAQEKEKQSLKSLLFSGKLKKDSSGVIRSTDDLSSKIDTSTKKEVAAAPVTKPLPPVNSQPVTTAKEGDRKVSIPKDEKATIIATPVDSSNMSTNTV